VERLGERGEGERQGKIKTIVDGEQGFQVFFGFIRP
jgi:hypothetical protein